MIIDGYFYIKWRLSTISDDNLGKMKSNYE